MLSDNDDNGSARRQVGWVGLMVVGEVMMATSAASLHTVGAWARFVCGALFMAAGGLQLRAPVLTRLRQWARDQPRKRWLRMGTWGVLVLIGPVVVWYGAPPTVAYGQILLNGCAHPVELRALIATDDLELYREIADGYEQVTAADNHGCRTVNISVNAIHPERGIAGLAAGWSEDYLRNDPRPDVLLSNSGTEVAALRAAVAESGREQRIDTEQEVAWSPLVLAVPVRLDGSLPEVDRSSTTWPEVLAAAQAADIGVVRPYPVDSGVGQLATDVLYTGQSGGLVDARGARDIERWVGASTDSGGYPFAASTLLLRAHRAATDPGSALIVPEQALVRSNEIAWSDGRIRQPDCAKPDAPQSCLVAYYPTDTFRVPHLFVPILWGDESPAREAAREFGEWLQRPAGQKALGDAGLRTNRSEPVRVLNERYGATPGPPRADTLRDALDAGRQDEVEELRELAQRDGRILVALDASGSMGTATGSGQTRFQTAVFGVDRALGLLGPKDKVGLWTFSGAGVRQIVPFGLKSAVAEPARKGLAAVTPAGTTPLFRAIDDGVAAIGPSTDRQISALVVLTDGENTAGGVGARQLVDTVRDRGVRVFVIALGEAHCATPVLTDVTRATRGACLDADEGTVDQTLTNLFQQLWG